MPKFVVTEIWTRSRVVDAPTEAAALKKGAPEHFPFDVRVDPGAQDGDSMAVEADDLGLNLSNWHATKC